jgi:hypothetical protein
MSMPAVSAMLWLCAGAAGPTIINGDKQLNRSVSSKDEGEAPALPLSLLSELARIIRAVRLTSASGCLLPGLRGA